MVQLSETLKTYLNSCAYNVTKDQEAISTEIKHVCNIREYFNYTQLEFDRVILFLKARFCYRHTPSQSSRETAEVCQILRAVQNSH